MCVSVCVWGGGRQSPVSCEETIRLLFFVPTRTPNNKRRPQEELFINEEARCFGIQNIIFRSCSILASICHPITGSLTSWCLDGVLVAAPQWNVPWGIHTKQRPAENNISTHSSEGPHYQSGASTVDAACRFVWKCCGIYRTDSFNALCSLSSFSSPQRHSLMQTSWTSLQWWTESLKTEW